MHSKESVQKVIDAHLAWVEAFREALQGKRRCSFNLDEAQDENACTLGRWLNSHEALEMLGAHYVERIKNLHGTFHDIAGATVLSLEANDPEMTTESLVNGLADVSLSVVQFLEHIKTKVQD